jgi:hypothetical protein
MYFVKMTFPIRDSMKFWRAQQFSFGFMNEQSYIYTFNYLSKWKRKCALCNVSAVASLRKAQAPACEKWCFKYVLMQVVRFGKVRARTIT